MRRRAFLATGSLALAGCRPATRAIEGGFTGIGFERGHLLRPGSSAAPGTGQPSPGEGFLRGPPTVTRRVHTLIAGGGVRYSGAETTLAEFATRHRVPVVETIAGRTVLVHDHPMNAGPIGGLGSSSANHLAAEADVVLAVGTRLQDFTTGSWSLFADDARFIGLNAARFDARKHLAQPVVGDAQAGLKELGNALHGWQAPESWLADARRAYGEWNGFVDQRSGPTNAELPTYAHVVGAVNRLTDPRDLALTAAGGMPGELCMNWRAKETSTFDCEFGFSCMGYEIAGGLGVKMARPGAEVIVMVGDGSYLMLNSEIATSVMLGRKLIVVVLDNRGYGCIQRLQLASGSPRFNNMIDDCIPEGGDFALDIPARSAFAAHGADFEAAFAARPRALAEAQASATVDRDGLELKFREAVAQDANVEMHLKADRSTRYESVAETMSAARRAGLTKIGFVTQPGSTPN